MSSRFFGIYLLEKGLITYDELEAAIKFQQETNLRLGDYALKKGLITKEQLEKITIEQHCKDMFFGELAVEMKILSREQVQQLLNQQQYDHIFIGEALINTGAIGKEMVAKELLEFNETEKEFEPEVRKLPSALEHAEILEVIFNITIKMFLRLLNLPAKLHSWYLFCDQVEPSFLAVSLGFEGEFQGQYIVNTNKQILNHACNYCFSDEGLPEGLTENDVMAEIINIICGNIAASLSDNGIYSEIGIPEMFENSHGPIQLPKDMQNLLFKVETPLGIVDVALSFKVTKKE